MKVFEKRWTQSQVGVGKSERKTIMLSVAVPNTLPFAPNDVCPRWEVKEFFDEQDKMIANLMPPSYKSRSFEIFYFFKIKVTHDSAFTDPSYSEPIPLRFEQSTDRQVMCQLADNDFDTIDFTDKIVARPFVPKKSLTMQQFIQRDQGSDDQIMQAKPATDMGKQGKMHDPDLIIGNPSKCNSLTLSSSI